MKKGIFSEQMEKLSCRRLTVPMGEDVTEAGVTHEIVVYLISGKAALTVSPSSSEPWVYPLEAYDSVWIPACTEFTMKNDGIGSMELALFDCGN